MSYFYSFETDQFYSSNSCISIPKDAICISDQKYAALSQAVKLGHKLVKLEDNDVGIAPNPLTMKWCGDWAADVQYPYNPGTSSSYTPVVNYSNNSYVAIALPTLGTTPDQDNAWVKLGGSGGSGGGNINSINGSTSPAQVIAGGTYTAVTNSGTGNATHTVDLNQTAVNLLTNAIPNDLTFDVQGSSVTGTMVLNNQTNVVAVNLSAQGGSGAVNQVTSANSALTSSPTTGNVVLTPVVNTAKGLTIGSSGTEVKVDGTTVQFNGQGVLTAPGGSGSGILSINASTAANQTIVAGANVTVNTTPQGVTTISATGGGSSSLTKYFGYGQLGLDTSVNSTGLVFAGTGTPPEGMKFSGIDFRSTSNNNIFYNNLTGVSSSSHVQWTVAIEAFSQSTLNAQITVQFNWIIFRVDGTGLTQLDASSSPVSCVFAPNNTYFGSNAFTFTTNSVVIGSSANNFIIQITDVNGQSANFQTAVTQFIVTPVIA
jgi:hypothetical protein